ncbi:MAG: response regulator [Candidatus Omnitrophica bacterium]|nr:response regulator [Candidatus Omnitrophota bacterium]
MSKKILICDDEVGIRESLKLILGDEFSLIAVEDSQQCLDCLMNSSKNIGLVLLDIKMPKVNGLDVLTQIKKHRSEVPVIMVTGYKAVGTATEATDRGASGYITKPFKSEDILEAARKFMK